MSTAGAGNKKTAGEQRPISSRRLVNRLFLAVCVLTSFLSVVILATLLISIAASGFSSLSFGFLLNPPSSNVEEAGINAALIGSLWVCSVCALFALPIGVGTAIFLEEYKPQGALLRRLHSLVQLNIANLSGVPSIVYGMIGVAAFVYMFGVFGRGEAKIEIGVRSFDQFRAESSERVYLRVPVSGPHAPVTIAKPGLRGYHGDELVELNVVASRAELPTDPDKLAITLLEGTRGSRDNQAAWYHLRLPFGPSVLAGGLTLMLVILPVVIVASQEALRAVPDSLREAAYGLGATRSQVVWNVTLPSAIPGIMTGSILAMSRAIGETAPILMISGTLFVPAGGPRSLMDEFTVMPLQIFNWTKDHRDGFSELAASGIIVLLVTLLSFNVLAVLIRYRMEKNNS